MSRGAKMGLAQTGRASQEKLGYARELQNPLYQIDCDGVHADDNKKERPPAEADHVDNRIEQRQEQQAPATGPEHEGAGPDILDDGKLQPARALCAPEIAEPQADAAG